VENALSARTQYARQGELLAQQLAAARDAERLYEVRYRAGATPLRTWLDAQEKRRAAERAVSENRLNQLNALATLYKALGGGVPAA
jgi:outer membrane protein TolC